MFRDNYGGLYAYALRRAAPDDAEEVVAETFSIAWRRWDDAPRDRVRPWLYGIARRVLANHYRGRLRRQRLLGRLSGRRVLGTAPLPETYAVARAQADQLSEALGRLREEDLEVLMLAAWEELDHHAIGEVLGCTSGAARVRLHRARSRLRAELDRGGARTGDHDDD